MHWKLSCASDEHEFIVLAYQGLYEGVTGVITQPVKGQQNVFAEQHMVNWAKLEARNSRFYLHLQEQRKGACGDL